MKHLVIVVRPFRAEQVAEVLHGLGAEVFASEVKGFGRQKGQLHEYTPTEYAAVFLPKIRIEACLPDAKVEEAIRQVTTAARTGRIGDGKLFVLDASTDVDAT